MRRARSVAVAAACLLGWLQGTAASATDLNRLSPETEQLLIELVGVAFHYDLYNERCRGYGVSSKLVDINDVLYPKYRVLADDVMLKYIGRTRLEAEEKLRAVYFEKLKALGGCEPAAEAGFEEELAERYRRLLERLRNEP